MKALLAGKTYHRSSICGHLTDTCRLAVIYRWKIYHDLYAHSSMELSRYPFVLTTTLGKSFEMTQMAVSQKWPVLLHGPIGSGMAALVQHLAEVTKNQSKRHNLFFINQTY